MRRLHQDYTPNVLLLSNYIKYSIDGSYWKIFHRELLLCHRVEDTILWKRGFKVLQNIENRNILQCDAPKVKEVVTRNTINKLDTNSESSLNVKQKHILSGIPC
jgi:hypothetical protein